MYRYRIDTEDLDQGRANAVDQRIAAAENHDATTLVIGGERCQAAAQIDRQANPLLTDDGRQQIEVPRAAQHKISVLDQAPFGWTEGLPASGSDPDHLDHATTIAISASCAESNLADVTSSRRCGGGIRCESGAVPPL